MSVVSKIRWLFVGGKVKAYNRAGTEAFHDGKYVEAENEFRESIRIFPEHEISHCNLGMVLASQNRLLEAEREFLQAIKLRSLYGDAYVELGRLYHRMGRKKDAHQVYANAVLLDPENPYLHINYATLLRDEGKFSEADGEYRKALASRRLDEATRRHLQDLLG